MSLKVIIAVLITEFEREINCREINSRKLKFNFILERQTVTNLLQQNSAVVLHPFTI
jgi:hypothetical protein